MRRFFVHGRSLPRGPETASMEGMLTPPNAVEALLFAAGEPLEKTRVANLLGIKRAELEVALESLGEQLDGRGIALVETELTIELRTSSSAAEIVKQYRASELSRDLGRASLETLAVIAYQSGTTRGEIDWVRGVNSSASIRTLLMRGLIEGREDPADKRRMRYTLTTEALAHLGVTRAADLPRFQELAKSAHEVIAESVAVEN